MKLFAFGTAIAVGVWLAYATIDSMLLTAVHLEMRHAVAPERR